MFFCSQEDVIRCISCCSAVLMKGEFFRPSHVCLHPPLRWGHRQQSQDSVCSCAEITDTKRGSDAELWNLDERRGLQRQVGMLSFNQKMIAFVWLLFDFLFFSLVLQVRHVFYVTPVRQVNPDQCRNFTFHFFFPCTLYKMLVIFYIRENATVKS